MGDLLLRIDKYVESDTAPEVYARIQLLNESGVERAPGHAPLTELIPVSHRPEDAKIINLKPGRYYVETVLPSGEILADSVSLTGDAPQELVLRAEDSPHEWLGWQHLLGNVQTVEAPAPPTYKPRGGRSGGQLTRLYVGNLSPQTSRQDLRELFSQAGKVESAEVVEDRGTRRSRGFGFVKMATPEGAEAAINQFDSREVGGRTITVQHERPREYRSTVARPRPPREVDVTRPILWLSQPDEALGHEDVWPWLTGLSLIITRSPTVPQSLFRVMNGGRDPHEIAPYASDDARALFRVSWSEVSGDVAQTHRANFGSVQPGFLVVARRRSVELVRLPVPWKVVTTNREADCEIVVQQPVRANGFCAAAVVRDEHFGTLLGYLSSGSLPIAHQMVMTARELLYYKFENPFAAAAGAYALVATARQASDEDWHRWVRNLMDRFPHIPDGAIQWGQMKLRMRRHENDIEEAREAFKLAYRRGLPFYSMGMRWLMDGLEWAAHDDEEAEEMLRNVRQIAWRTHYQQPVTIIKLGGERGV